MAKTIGLLVLVGLALDTAADGQAVYPLPVAEKEMPALLEATQWVRSLDEAQLVALVPEQSGLFYVGCPNCDAGRQERQLAWTHERPDEVHCLHCEHRYPSEKYPETAVLEVRNPRGEVHRYPYWEDASGYRYFFQAKRDDLVKTYLASRALELARLYHTTRDGAHARRAALIVDRFAQVFPGWCYHFDYPHRQKQIFEGDIPPAKFLAGYRTARWSWWAYVDVPLPLVQSYDLIRGSGALQQLGDEQGVDVERRIIQDLFRNSAEQVLANPEPYTNMSPAAWRSFVVTGRVIDEPAYVHESVRRLTRLVQSKFMYDGSWYEGAPDYAAQTVTWLDRVLEVLRGYSDPPGYRDPVSGERFDSLVLEEQFPALRQAKAALAAMRFPDGRHVTVHDTWSTTRRDPLEKSDPFLLPALGHACLAGGAHQQQTQLHLTWSGGYGHQHGDNLSLILFANGREILSDIGYTHTRHRAWTLATAAHNTVVIDGQNQWMGSIDRPSDGSLRWFDARDGRVQVVSADGQRGYPETAALYRRTLALIDGGNGRKYAVDLFEVEGGDQHDYFLHGDADVPGSATTKHQLQPLKTLLPDGMQWTAPKHEGETSSIREPYWAYGFFRDLRSSAAPAGEPLAVTFREADGPAVRVTLLPESNSQLILGENPSVRNAKENDQALDRHHRPFLALRREADGAHSRFVAVLEPYADEPFIRSIKPIDVDGAALALQVDLDGRRDWVVIGASKQVKFPAGRQTATFAGEIGVISLRGDEVQHAYALGEGGWSRGEFELRVGPAQKRPLLEITDDALVVSGPAERLPAAGSVVRLISADGWVYPFNVNAAEATDQGVRIIVAEGPGMTFDSQAKRLELTSFPQRQHSGEVHVDWVHSASTAEK